MRGIDGCIVTHLHGDHFDDAAAELLPRDLPVLTQPESADALRERGFTQVEDTLRRLARPRPRADARPARHRRDRRGAGPGLAASSSTASTSRATRSGATRCARRSSSTGRTRSSSTRGGARFNEGDPIVMTVDDVRDVRAATDATRRRRAPRGDEPLPRAARRLPRRSTASSCRTTARRSTRAAVDGQLAERAEHDVGERERVVAGREVRVRHRERRASRPPSPSGCRCASPRPPSHASGRRRAGALPRGRRRATACRARPPATRPPRGRRRRARHAQHDLDQLGVRRRGDRDRPALGDRAHDLGGAVDQRRRLAVAGEHALRRSPR